MMKKVSRIIPLLLVKRFVFCCVVSFNPLNSFLQGGYPFIALYDYDAGNAGELSFRVGDVLQVIQEVKEGWYSASFNGKWHLFYMKTINSNYYRHDCRSNWLCSFQLLRTTRKSSWTSCSQKSKKGKNDDRKERIKGKGRCKKKSKKTTWRGS